MLENKKRKSRNRKKKSKKNSEAGGRCGNNVESLMDGKSMTQRKSLKNTGKFFSKSLNERDDFVDPKKSVFLYFVNIFF